MQEIAYLNRDSLFLAVPNYIENLKSLEEIKKMNTKEIQKNRQELQQRLNALLSNYAPKETEKIEDVKKRMSNSDTIKLGMILDEDKAITQKEKRHVDLLAADFKYQIEPYNVKVDDIIKEYTKKNKIDIVYSINEIAPALVYINPRKNITKAIVNEIKAKIKK